MQTSKFSTMSMMNRKTHLKSLCQFPSKLFSWSINSATRCSSNSYPTTTVAPRIAPVNSIPRSNIHGGFPFPSSFLQMSLGPGNLKFNVSRCNSILRQNLCFSTTQYEELASKSVVDDEFGKKNAADLEEKILLKPRVAKGGDKSLTFSNTMRYKTAAGYKSVSVTKMGLSEVKYYCSTGGSDSDSEEEGNTDDDMNDVGDEDNNDAPGPPPGPGPTPGPTPGPVPVPAPEEVIVISDDLEEEEVNADVDMNDVGEEDNNVDPEEVIFISDDEEGTGSTNSNDMEVFYHSDDGSTEESSTNFNAPAAPANENENLENDSPPVPEGNYQIDPPVAEGNNQIDPPVPEGNNQIDPPAPAANVNEPGPAANVNVPAPGANVNVPAPGANVNVPAHPANVNVPAHPANVNVPAPRADEDEIMRGSFADIDTFKGYFD